jgi:hypothetical protein
MVALIKVATEFDLREDLVYKTFNILAISVSSIMLLFLSRLIWGHERISVLPFIWVTCPFVLWFLNQPYSEIPFFVLFFLTVLLTLLSYRSTGSRQIILTMLTGMTSAMSMLIRPAGIGIPIVICSVFLLTVSKRDLRHLAKYITALVLGLVIIITPWSAITYQKTGQVMLLTDGSLMRGSLLGGVTFASDEPIRQQIQIPRRVLNLMSSLETVLDSGISGLELTRNIGRVLSDKPLVTLHFIGIKMSRSWYGTYTHQHEHLSLGLQIFYLAMALYAAVRGVICRILPQDFVLLASFITLYFWFLSTLFEPLVRYMVPAIGLLFIFLPVLWRSRTQNKTQNIH